MQWQAEEMLAGLDQDQVATWQIETATAELGATYLWGAENPGLSKIWRGGGEIVLLTSTSVNITNALGSKSLEWKKSSRESEKLFHRAQLWIVTYTKRLGRLEEDSSSQNKGI